MGWPHPHDRPAESAPVRQTSAWRRLLTAGLVLMVACAPAPTPTPTPAATPATLTVYLASPRVAERAQLLSAAARIEVVDRSADDGLVALGELAARSGSPRHLAVVDADILAREIMAVATPRLAETTLIARRNSPGTSATGM